MKSYTSVAVDDADEDHGLPSDPLPGFKKPTASNNADDSDVLPKPIKTSFQEKLAEKGPDSPDTAESAADKKKLLKRQADACFSKVMLCTIAISLVWMSSLGVARFIVQSAIASPPFSVVSFECMRGWDKMVSEKEGHTACTSVQAKSTPPARARRRHTAASRERSLTRRWRSRARALPLSPTAARRRCRSAMPRSRAPPRTRLRVRRRRATRHGLPRGPDRAQSTATRVRQGAGLSRDPEIEGASADRRVARGGSRANFISSSGATARRSTRCCTAWRL